MNNNYRRFLIVFDLHRRRIWWNLALEATVWGLLTVA